MLWFRRLLSRFKIEISCWGAIRNMKQNRRKKGFLLWFCVFDIWLDFYWIVLWIQEIIIVCSTQTSKAVQVIESNLINFYCIQIKHTVYCKHLKIWCLSIHKFILYFFSYACSEIDLPTEPIPVSIFFDFVKFGWNTSALLYIDIQ